MTNLDKFNAIIADVFSIENIEEVEDSFGPDEIENWDSLNHIELVTNLEEKFKISLAVEDVSRMYTIGDVKNILKKYGVEV
jgi:acyl carrier protein